MIIDKLWEDAHNDNERLIKIAEENNVYHRLYTSEHLLVGETGWKRDLTEEEQEQDLLVNFMTNFMDELTIIGDEMVETVEELYSLPVLTREQVVEKSKMLEFLKRNKGKRSITIPW